MTYKSFATFFFEKRLKSLFRKYPKVREDLKHLLDDLERNPHAGDRLQGCKGPVFKVRMGSRDLQRGKSGGFRVIYLIQEKEKEIYLLTLYPKSERENIHSSQINEILIQTGLHRLK